MDDKKHKWYREIVAQLNAIAEEIGIDESASQRIRDFVTATAKSQYMAGNKAGIYWARTGKNKALAA